MCGRFGLYDIDPDTWWRQFHARFKGEWQPRYNIAPTQQILAIRNDDRDTISPIHWGFVPAWSNDPTKVGFSNINAKVERVATSPVYRGAFKRRRCLILANCFYEWRKGGGGAKTPYLVRMRSGEPFAFAGLWERRDRDGEAPLHTCVILTCGPNDLMAPIHNRMPVILSSAAYDAWLEPGEVQPADLMPTLQPYPSEEMDAFAISTRVNSVRNDDRSIVEPLGASA
ncbi:SOS response-associated peptidase [bacterium]|nr:MAG: SOS response-associated peptidase [bacterium]